MKLNLDTLQLNKHGLLRESFTDYTDKLTRKTVNAVTTAAGNLYLKTYGEEYLKAAKKNNVPMAEAEQHLNMISDTLYQRGMCDEKGAAIVQELLAPKDERFIYSELIVSNEGLFPEAVILNTDIANSDNRKAEVFGHIVQNVFDDINDKFGKILTLKIQ